MGTVQGLRFWLLEITARARIASQEITDQIHVYLNYSNNSVVDWVYSGLPDADSVYVRRPCHTWVLASYDLSTCFDIVGDDDFHLLQEAIHAFWGFILTANTKSQIYNCSSRDWLHIKHYHSAGRGDQVSLVYADNETKCCLHCVPDISSLLCYGCSSQRNVLEQETQQLNQRIDRYQ